VQAISNIWSVSRVTAWRALAATTSTRFDRVRPGARKSLLFLLVSIAFDGCIQMIP
jgi:hypothetical protein